MRNKIGHFAFSALLACQGSGFCWAQDGWAAYLQAWRENTPVDRKPWTLRVRKGDQKDAWWRRDEGLDRLVADKEVAIELLDHDSAATLWKAKQWGPGPRWLLLDRTGEPCFDGPGTPKGEAILAAIHTVEERTVWEQREAFLKDHPDHGEALEARLATAMALARSRFRVLVEDNQARPFQLDKPGSFLLDQDATGQTADQVFADLADTLERLNALPDGWRLSPTSIFGLGLVLKGFDAGASPRMRATLQALREKALEAWARTPNREEGFEPQTFCGPQELWVACNWVLEGGTLTSLPRLIPSPGQTFPQRDLLLFVANEIRDPQALLDFLAIIPAEAPEGPLTPAQWEAYRFRQANLSGLYARAYAQQGRWDQATLALQECRNWFGTKWKDIVLFSDFAKEGTQDTAAEGPPRSFLELLKSDPAPDLPPPPVPRPIRMVLWGSPTWTQAWMGLAKAAPLAPWGGEELRWAAPNPDEEAALARLGWQPPRWVAFQGPTTILASGQDLPTPQSLAFQLSVTGPTRLQVLDRFIRQNPEHLEARRERFSLLRPRMPCPALESVLAEDAAQAWLPLDFDPKAPWLSDPQPWAQQVVKLMPNLEAALGRWPSSRKLWRTWITWQPFTLTPRSTYAFAMGLAVLQPQGEWLAELPKEVHAAVAAELRASARFGQMRDWFQSAWDVVAPRKDDPAGNRQALFQGLAEALAALHLDGDLQELKKHNANLAPPQGMPKTQR